MQGVPHIIGFLSQTLRHLTGVRHDSWFDQIDRRAFQSQTKAKAEQAKRGAHLAVTSYDCHLCTSGIEARVHIADGVTDHDASRGIGVELVANLPDGFGARFGGEPVVAAYDDVGLQTEQAELLDRRLAVVRGADGDAHSVALSQRRPKPLDVPDGQYRLLGEPRL